MTPEDVEKMRKELERQRWENVWLLQRNMALEARLRLMVTTLPTPTKEDE